MTEHVTKVLSLAVMAFLFMLEAGHANLEPLSHADSRGHPEFSGLRYSKTDPAPGWQSIYSNRAVVFTEQCGLLIEGQLFIGRRDSGVFLGLQNNSNHEVRIQRGSYSALFFPSDQDVPLSGSWTVEGFDSKWLSLSPNRSITQVLELPNKGRFNGTDRIVVVFATEDGCQVSVDFQETSNQPRWNFRNLSRFDFILYSTAEVLIGGATKDLYDKYEFDSPRGGFGFRYFLSPRHGIYMKLMNVADGSSEDDDLDFDRISGTLSSIGYIHRRFLSDRHMFYFSFGLSELILRGRKGSFLGDGYIDQTTRSSGLSLGADYEWVMTNELNFIGVGDLAIGVSVELDYIGYQGGFVTQDGEPTPRIGGLIFTPGLSFKFGF